MDGPRKATGQRLTVSGSRQGNKVKIKLQLAKLKASFLTSYWINTHTGERTDEDPFKHNLTLEMKNKVIYE